MALDKQLIPVTFDNKLDTKSDPKLSAGFSRVENMFRKRSGEYRKRYGFDALPSTVYSGDTAIADDIYVSDFNKELVSITSNDIYSYSESDDKWKEIDDDFKLWTLDSIKTNAGAYYLSAQVAVSDKYILVVTIKYENAVNRVYYTVLDVITNSIVVKETGLGTAYNETIKVISNGTYFYILYVIPSFNDIRIRSFNKSTLALTTQDVSGNFFKFDAICDDNNIFIYANNNTDCKLIKYSSTLSFIDEKSIGTTAGTYQENTVMRLTLNGTNLVAYFCYNDASLRKPFIGYFTSALVQINASTAMPTVANVLTDVDFDNFAGYVDPTDATKFIVLTSSSSYGTVYTVTAKAVWNLATNASAGANTLNYGFSVADNAFLIGTTPYTIMTQRFDVNVVTDVNLYQSTAYLLNLTSGLFEGIFSVGLFNNNNNGYKTCNSVYFSNVLYCPSMEIIDNNTSNVLIKRIYQDITKLSLPTKTNNELIIPNLIPLSYTGNELIETNYSQFPYLVRYTNTGAGTGIATGKTYSYYIIASHLDRNGVKRYSALSNVLTFAKTDAFIWNIIFYGTSYNRNNQTIDIYRTEGDGSIYYFIASVIDVSGSLITYSDTIADANIIINKLLYTTGGVLESYLPSSAGIVKILKNRLFMARCEDQDRVYYSKELAANYAPEMSPYNVIEFFDSEGPVIGLGQIDDKLFFFKQEAIFYVVGELNDDLGQNASFSMNKIPGNIGLTDFQAICEFANGIIFKSSRGFYLLDRGLGISYIGSPVEAFNSVNITSSVLMSNDNQIRFSSASGTCLIYDYLYEEWYTYTNILATSATNWEGSFVFAKSNGTFYKENIASWLDVATPIISKIQTGWLSLAGIQGFQRIYKGLILGEYRGSHTLKVSIGTNFKTYFDEQITVSTSTLTGAITTDSSYFADYATGTTDSVYQFTFRPATQKCESMRFLIEDAFTSGNEGFTISALSLEVGAKQGLAKLTQTKNMS